MLYQERYGKQSNIVTKELDYTGIMYTIDPVTGAVGLADQDIQAPKSKLNDEIGGMAGGRGGLHRAVRIHEDKVLAKGVPLLNWEQVTKIFDLSEKEKISLAQAAFKVVGRDKFRGEVAARFDKTLPHHYCAFEENAVEAPVIVTAPNTPRKKLVEKDGAFQTVPG